MLEHQFAYWRRRWCKFRSEEVDPRRHLKTWVRSPLYKYRNVRSFVTKKHKEFHSGYASNSEWVHKLAGVG